MISTHSAKLWTVLQLDGSHLIKLLVSLRHIRLKEILESVSLLCLLHHCFRIYLSETVVSFFEASDARSLRKSSTIFPTRLLDLFLGLLLLYQLLVVLFDAVEFLAEARH